MRLDGRERVIGVAGVNCGFDTRGRDICTSKLYGIHGGARFYSNLNLSRHCNGDGWFIGRMRLFRVGAKRLGVLS